MVHLANTAARVAAVCALALSVACAQQDESASPAADIYPPGVKAFRNLTVASNAGLYPASSMRACCFLKKHAMLLLDKPAGARVATLHFFVPKAPYKGAQSLTVTIGAAVGRASTEPGKSVEISLSFPAKYIGATVVPIDIEAAKAFVPQKADMGNDTREISAILQRVDFH